MALVQNNVRDVRLIQDENMDSDGKKYNNIINVSRERNDERNGENACDKILNDFDVHKYEKMDFKSQIRWLDLIAQILLHLVTLYGLICIITNKPMIYTTLFMFAIIPVSAFGVTAGVHRLWSHRAYKARLPLRILLAFLFTITGQRDIYTWALDHRVHHKYSETVADPHNIHRGFWFAHVGWLFLTPHPAVVDRRIALTKTSLDLMADPVVKYQKMLFIPSFFLLNILLPTVIPMYYWGETLVNSFVLCFVTRFTLTLNVAYSVNSFAHLCGNKPYDRFIMSVENTLVSLASIGEGWHNYHHAFPWDYRASELGKMNPSTLFIDLFAKIGWAYDLKAATPEMVKKKAERCGDGTLH